MKNFKATLLLIVILAATSCGKKGDPAPDETPPDFTKYYVAGKFNLETSGNTVSIPFAIIMKPNNSAYLVAGDGENVNGSYSYTHKHLIIKLDAATVDVTLDGEKATNMTVSTVTVTQFSLEKTPDTSVFDGNFAGSMNSTGSKTPIQLLALRNITFAGDLYGFGLNAGSTHPTLSYIPINYGVATSNTGNNGTLSFFMMMKGQLEVIRRTDDVNTETFDYGTYTKQ